MNENVHHRYMREAIALSREAMDRHGGGPFGAVIVRNGEIIGRGGNLVTAALDPTAHAEIVAIRDACRSIGDFSLRGCIIYSSCEPCPMCLSAIYWARLEAIYFANTREDAARIGFDDALLYREVALPLGSRALKAKRIAIKEAADIFLAWDQKADKTPY